MPFCEGRFIRQPNGQYTWLYYKDNLFQEIGGTNLTLTGVFNGIRDKIALEAGVGNSKEGSVAIQTP